MKIMTKKTYNQILMGEGFNFGQRMNLIRIKKREEKKKKQEAIMAQGLKFFESGGFAKLFKPEK